MLAWLVAAMLLMACHKDSKDDLIVIPGTEVPTAEVTGEATPEPTSSLEPSQEAMPSVTEAVTPTAGEPVLTSTEEEAPLRKVGVFDIHSLYEQYGSDDYQLLSSDGKIKAERKYGSIYINGEWVYSATTNPSY